jgi:FKBP-type peptidyl-prolyl cis-trans isomerase FklB
MMRSSTTLIALVLVSTSMNAAYSQNDLPPAGAPGGAGQQQAAPGVPAGQAAPADDPNYHAHVSYALGRNFATNLKQNNIDCDLKALMAGISDALTGAQPKLTDEQCNAVLDRFGREMQQQQMTKMQQAAAKNQQEEAAFLAQNSKREGVEATQTGLQYRVIQQGQGPSPTLNDTVKCNYRGTLINGTEFDSSAQHGGPAEFKLMGGPRGLIPGWVEALQKMHVGDKWQLFVPAKLAYGMNPPGPPIEPGSPLVFEIELLDIVKQ